MNDVYKRWVYNVTLGEFLGFTIPSIVGVLTVNLDLIQYQQTLVVILAGIAEGTILGCFSVQSAC